MFADIFGYFASRLGNIGLRSSAVLREAVSAFRVYIPCLTRSGPLKYVQPCSAHITVPQTLFFCLT
jgi:hypothetical protein